MMNFENLTDKNIELYCIKYYNNPQCLSLNDYKEDLKKIKYLKRLFNNYFTSGILKERLILNHLIMLFNVFDNYALSRILFFKFDKKYYSLLKTFLMYLNHIPPKFVRGIRGEDVSLIDIQLDEVVVDKLREL